MSRPAWLVRLCALAVFAALMSGACQDPETNEAQFHPATPALAAAPPKEVLRLPKKLGSFRFAALGDMGRGDKWQYDVSKQMQAFRKEFPFDFVIMLGDNIYDGATRADYRQKFELPYKPFLDDGVDFYAAFGNHDEPNQPSYAPFHMGGHRYYTFKPKAPLLSRLTSENDEVQFFMIDTEDVDRTQRQWLEREMARSNARWKIPVFHRPIYTSAAAIGAPIVSRSNVDRNGFAGHPWQRRRGTM